MTLSIVAREAALFQAANDANPFQGALLRDTAARMGPSEVAEWLEFLSNGFVDGVTTAAIVRDVVALKEVRHG